MIKQDYLAHETRSAAKVDNRVFFRNPLYDVKTRIKNIHTGDRFEAYVKDLSGSGMGLGSTQACAKGTVLEISLEIPDGFGPLKLLGRVVWSKQDAYEGCRAGVVILNPRFMSVSRILKLFF